MGKITRRADKFAHKLRPKEPVDDRPTDVKLAEFAKKYTPEAIKRVRRRLNDRKING